MASFVDPDDQHTQVWETATEFEPLRMMCLCLTVDPSCAAFMCEEFPLELLKKHTTASSFMSDTWHRHSLLRR